MADSKEQKRLKRLIERRHPEYASNVAHWTFLSSTYNGGRQWFANNLFKYLKEGKAEFDDRLARAYRFNHTREVVNLVNKHIFKAEIARNEADAKAPVARFWRRATRGGKNIDFFMKYVSQRAAVFGRVAVVVDSTNTEPVISVADAKRVDARVFAYVVEPIDILDMGYDDTEELVWILLREIHRDDVDPFASGELTERFRLWTRDGWAVYEVHETARKSEVVEIDRGEHGLGRVPVFFADDQETDNPYTAPALIGDIAYLDRAVGNYLSNLDAIIQDQTFSQLAIPAQGLLPGDDDAKINQITEMGTKRIFTYDGEAQSAPFFLSPDPKQVGVILEVINKIISEIYHSVGMAGERTKQDNSVGIDNSSGVAKAYDFTRLDTLLANKARSLETVENKLIELVGLYHGEIIAEDERPLVKYPESFDVRGLYDEFEVASRLALIDAPDTVKREQIKVLVDKIFPRLAEKIRAAMLKEIENDWPSSPESLLASGVVGKPQLKSKETPAGDTNQGQNQTGDGKV